MNRRVLAAGIVGIACTLTASASAQFQVRIVQRSGQTVVSPVSPAVDLTVQIKAPSGSLLSAFAFNMRIVGEAESRGVLTRSQISNNDGTYFNGVATSNTVGIGGIARQYAYLAGLNSGFNGLRNTSGGSFTNGPDQEFGVVAGHTAGSWLVGIPGMDADGDGNPDTWIGNGSSSNPSGWGASVPETLRGPYFAEGEFIDVYRFRYTVTDFSAGRTLNFQLENVEVSSMQFMLNNQGLWGPNLSLPQLHTQQGLTIPVIPSPSIGTVIAGSTVLGLSLRRRHTPSISRKKPESR